jgi:hypothetical protein
MLGFRTIHVGPAAQACPERSRRGCPVGHSPAVLCALKHCCVLLTILAAPLLSASDCLSIHQASQHVGETKCVTGKVIRIKQGAKGIHYLDFCEDQLACPFTVVVFPSDLKDVGDIRRLAGRTIEVRGAVKLYDSRAEIILKRISQIAGGAALIPPLPKEYDVENRGHYSAGRLRPTKKPATVKAKPNTTATYGNDVEGEEPPQD